MSCACAHDRNRRDQCHRVRKELRELPGLPARLELPEAPVLQELQVLLVALAVAAPPEVQLWPAAFLLLRNAPESIAHQESMVCWRVMSQVLWRRDSACSELSSELKRLVCLPVVQVAWRRGAQQWPESQQRLPRQ